LIHREPSSQYEGGKKKVLLIYKVIDKARGDVFAKVFFHRKD